MSDTVLARDTQGVAFQFDSIGDHAATENFPVALRILTRAQRRHLLAFYRFARLTDQIGDVADGDRIAQLDALEQQLDRALGGHSEHRIATEVAQSVRELAMPAEPLRRLIDANRRDQHKHRTSDWADLLDYCRLSANPIGEIVLHVFGSASADRLPASDAICSALQVTEHLQDVAEDYAAGRVYLPADDLARFGVTDAQLAAAAASDALRALIRFEAKRARTLLDDGEGLIGSVHGRARIAIAGFAAGGHAALDAIERCGGDVLATQARPTRGGLLRHMTRLFWRASTQQSGTLLRQPEDPVKS